MLLHSKSNKPTRNWPLIGILIDTNRTDCRHKKNSMIFQKPMKFSQAETEGHIMMRYSIRNIPSKMLTKLFRNFLLRMESDNKVRSSSLNNTTHRRREPIMMCSKFLIIAHRMILSMPIESKPSNIIRKIIMGTQKHKGGLLK